jgi:hypothetical protein
MIGRVPSLNDLNLALSEKLGILRRLDHFRSWRSLDDKRYCLGCDRIIRGGELRMIGNLNNPASLRLMCPTDECPSIPMDWALSPNDAMARLSRHAGEKIPVAAPLSERPPWSGRMRGSLRKLANQWFRAG